MNAEEIRIRAREAVIEVHPIAVPEVAIRAGHCDGDAYIQCVIRALRDLSKPLDEIRPVDPDLIEARKIAFGFVSGSVSAPNYHGGFYDDRPEVQTALAAIKRGRELERDQ